MAVDELNIHTLILYVQEYLIKHKREFLQQNLVELLEMTYQHPSFTTLWNHCLKEICKNPKTLFNSNKFIKLEASLLELLLKRDDLFEKICENSEILFNSSNFFKLEASSMELLLKRDPLLKKICEWPEKLFNTGKFIKLEATLLELFLKRDDLSLPEIDIWNNLLKWGLARNPSISEDITKWNEEDITIMKRTIHKIIPLIRFYHISSEDFLDRIYPLKDLLSKDLIHSLLTFFLASDRISDIQPPRQPKIICDSILIKYQRVIFSIFASWIDKKESSYYNLKEIPYKFNLLYRASRDGNTVEVFHDKCDDKKGTIVVAKIANSERIVGGYNPLFWNSNETLNFTKDSFIFSFKNRANPQTAKMGYSKSEQSLLTSVTYGPIFGNGPDLYYNGINWGGNPGTYPPIDIPTTFIVEDYEVFKVQAKLVKWLSFK